MTAGARVNGRNQAFGAIAPGTTALDWLRSQRLTGAKEGCAEGECGACAIMVARPSTTGDGSTEWVALNACLMSAVSLDGQEVRTAEGLGTPSELHPVQREVAVRGGSQCGYCTPGFVCSMAAEYYRAGRCPSPAMSSNSASDPRHEPHEPHNEVGPNGFDLSALSGNLCRCTGYRPIRDAAFALGGPEPDDVIASRRAEAPPAPVATRFRSGSDEFIRPSSLAEALGILTERPDCRVVAGSTDWGVEVNLRAERAALVIAVDRLPELRELSYGSDEIRLGAALTLTEMERRLAGSVPLLAEMLPQFGSRLIRNAATLGGSLGTGSPVGDAAPALLALQAQVVLASVDGERVVPLCEYFTGYRASVRAPEELIREVRIPRPLSALTGFHKIAKRRFDDISSVAVGLALDVTDGVVSRAVIGLGGIAAIPMRARNTEAALIGQPWSAKVVGAAADVMAKEGTPLDDLRASAAYRAAMLGQSLRKLYSQHPPREGVVE